MVTAHGIPAAAVGSTAPRLRAAPWRSAGLGPHHSLAPNPARRFDFSALPAGRPWWHTTRPEDLAAICKEPQQAYEERLAELAQLLHGLPFSSVALVAHWGVLRHVSGQDLAPGQLASCELQRHGAR
jgi:hypothetical protein